MKTLVFGQMPKGATPETHIPAGPWCFEDAEDIFPDWDTAFSFPPLPYTDIDMLDQECNRARNWAVRQIADIADRYQGQKKLPLGIWEFVLVQWALNAASIIHDNSLRLETLLSLYGDQQLNVSLVASDTIRSWCSSSEFFYDFISPCGLYWLYSRLLEHKGIPPGWKIEMVPGIDLSTYKKSTEKIHFKQQHQKNSVIRTLLWPVRIMYRTLVKVRNFIRRIPLPHRLLGSVLNVFLLTPFLLMNRNKEDNTIPLQEEYPDFEELPAYYSTIFKAMLPDSFQNISEKIKGRKCIFSTFVTDSTFFTDEGILKMAGYKLGGTRIVITQHAPPYIFVAKLSTVYLEGFQHALITWGNLPFSRKLRHSAPNLNYARLYNKHHLTVASVLYIMDSEYLSPPNFEAALYTYTPKVRSFHKKLIGALDKNVKDAMYMRPRPCYTSFDTEAWIRKTFPDIPIHEASISLLKALRHCKLSIVTYMGSTFNQALTLNSPVIWVLDRSEYLFTQEALDLLKHMQDVKIYFSDPLQAAKHINNVWSDIDSWWDSKEVQAVRAECLKIDMGLPCKKPLRKWIKAIKAL